MDAVNHGLGRPQDESSASSLKRAGEVTQNRDPKVAREHQLMSMSGPLCSKSLIPGCTRSLQNLRMPAIETTGPARKVPSQLKNSSGHGGSMDSCFISSHCPQLSLGIPIGSISHGSEMR